MVTDYEMSMLAAKIVAKANGDPSLFDGLIELEIAKYTDDVEKIVLRNHLPKKVMAKFVARQAAANRAQRKANSAAQPEIPPPPIPPRSRRDAAGEGGLLRGAWAHALRNKAGTSQD